MPVTQGAGNPDWSWDETLLALDLLYRHGAPLGKNHPDVVKLSATLRAARLFPMEGRKDSFRNTDGVGLKMQNLQSALNPERRLSSSKTDRAIVAEYPPEKKLELAAVAVNVLTDLASESSIEDVPDNELFREGRVITASHRARDRRLRSKLLAKCDDANLLCSVCDFTPPALERGLRESFFEAHHIIPLSAFSGETKTSVKDMALVCAGCHRFVHRLISSRKRWVSIDEARSDFSNGSKANANAKVI